MRFKLLEQFYESPEYRAKVQARLEVLKNCQDEPLNITRLALEKWSVDPIDFIETFGWVIIPEFNNAIKPFFLFPYQKKIITKIWEAELSGQDHEILIDKPRGMGLTWTIVWYQIWRWCFTPNWGGFNLSRSESEVDDGTADAGSSIFGKYRWSLAHLPSWLLPEGYVPKGKKGNPTDMMLRISNPQIGSSLIGSSTNQQAGRSRRYAFCLTGDTLVLTPNGFKEIKEIVEKNITSIIGGDGKVYNIKKYIKVPPQKIYRVLLRGGIEIKGTGDHPIMIWDKKKKKDIGFKSLSELTTADNVKIYKGGFSFPVNYVPIDLKKFEEEDRKFVKQYTRKMDLKIPNILDERLAKFMGYLVSEGSIPKTCSTISFVNTDKEVIDDFVNLTKDLFGLNPRINFKKGGNKTVIVGRLCNTKDQWTVSMAGAHIRSVLSAFGFTFGSAWEKEIPKAIFSSPRSVISAFLNSLFEGDGCVNIESDKRRSNRKLRVSYTTTSQKLANQIQSIMYLMGYMIHNKRYKDPRNEKPTWHILNRLNLFGGGAVKFCEEIGIKKYNKFRNEEFKYGKNNWEFLFQAINKIEIIEPEETYDFEVDSNDHSFVSNMVISHNCFIDECFAIEHFQSVYRSLQSVSRVKVFVSTVKSGRIYQDFKTLCEQAGDYISLSWKDHPFKDQEWYDEQVKKAEFDPDVMKEIEVDYSVNIRSQYYPEIRQAKTLPDIPYIRGKPIYVSLDFGSQDRTVIIYSQFDGQYLNILECVSNVRKNLDWYVPYLNPGIVENPEHYTPYFRDLLRKIQTWDKPTAYFGEAAHFQKVMPLNRSIADELIKYGIRLISNNYAIKHEPRRHATTQMLPKTVFNFGSDSVAELYDAIANSRYAESMRGTSKESHMKPVHDDGISDFRSAFENLCVNIPRIFRNQRKDIGDNVKKENFANNLVKYLKI